jgi:iron complex outermembrane receptor protein
VGTFSCSLGNNTPKQPSANAAYKSNPEAPTTYGAWLMWDDSYNAKPWGVGAGFNYVDKRAGDIQNDFWLPSYTVWNATAYYEPARNVRVQLTLNNLTNEHYYAGSNSRFNIMQGAPFTSMLSVDYKF